VRVIAPEHRAQTVNYLRVTGMKLGLLVKSGSTHGLRSNGSCSEGFCVLSVFSVVPSFFRSPPKQNGPVREHRPITVTWRGFIPANFEP
jgi:hypothetical protein